MATRCFWPPESRCGSCWRYSAISTTRRASSTRATISAGGSPRFSGPKATSSSTTVATSWLSGFWKTMPTRCRISDSAPRSLVFMPSTNTSPSVGSSRAFRCLARVDLPDPFPPTMATNSPRSTVRAMPSRAMTASAVPAWYTCRRLRVSIRGMLICTLDSIYTITCRNALPTRGEFQIVGLRKLCGLCRLNRLELRQEFDDGHLRGIAPARPRPHDPGVSPAAFLKLRRHIGEQPVDDPVIGQQPAHLPLGVEVAAQRHIHQPVGDLPRLLRPGHGRLHPAMQ